jgi:uncharacterized protein (TIGR03067 family)
MRALLLVGILTIAAPVRPERNYPRPEEPKPLREQIIGDWLLVKIANGTPRMEYAPVNNVLRITPSETIFMIDGKASAGDGLTAAYSIDWATSPISIEFRPKQRGGTLPGILKVEGDMLILGLTSSKDQGPQDFASAHLVAHFTRVRK